MHSKWIVLCLAFLLSSQVSVDGCFIGAIAGSIALAKLQALSSVFGAFQQQTVQQQPQVIYVYPPVQQEEVVEIIYLQPGQVYITPDGQVITGQQGQQVIQQPFPGQQIVQQPFPGQQVQFPGQQVVQFPGQQVVQFPGQQQVVQFPGQQVNQVPGNNFVVGPDGRLYLNGVPMS